MGIVLIRAINWFAEILITMLLIQCILSWFAQNPASPLYNIYRFLTQLTDPFVAPFRRLLSNFNTGMFDFSVLLAFFAIEFVQRILVALISVIMF
ncbi:MAG: YggT family protein [Eubacteriales bacterium]|nr:YggT family protein [Eubacteriales bacterium]